MYRSLLFLRRNGNILSLNSDRTESISSHFLFLAFGNMKNRLIIEPINFDSIISIQRNSIFSMLIVVEITKSDRYFLVALRPIN